MNKTCAALLAGILAAGTMASPALAGDRAPTGEEIVALDKAMKAAGYVSWEEVELDSDGPYWDVDDARTKDGARFDLKIRPGTLEILSRDAED